MRPWTSAGACICPAAAGCTSAYHHVHVPGGVWWLSVTHHLPYCTGISVVVSWCRMPIARYCARCRTSHDGRCPQRVQRAPDSRPSAHSRGYDARWRTWRAALLASDPLCAECRRRGLIVPATSIDHIRPHRGDARLFWSPDNVQPLCTSCHAAKSARERADGGGDWYASTYGAGGGGRAKSLTAWDKNRPARAVHAPQKPAQRTGGG